VQNYVSGFNVLSCYTLNDIMNPQNTIIGRLLRSDVNNYRNYCPK
jgi:hypothetical protein